MIILSSRKLCVCFVNRSVSTPSSDSKKVFSVVKVEIEKELLDAATDKHSKEKFGKDYDLLDDDQKKDVRKRAGKDAYKQVYMPLNEEDKTDISSLLEPMLYGKKSRRDLASKTHSPFLTFVVQSCLSFFPHIHLSDLTKDYQ